MTYVRKAYFTCCAILTAAMLVVSPRPAAAQCENAGSAAATLASDLIAEDLTHLEEFTQQETNFIVNDLQTAQNEIITRLQEFDYNIREWFEEWWADDMRPALQEMTKQLNTSEVDQSRTRGSMLDAQLQIQTQQEFHKREAQAHRRFRPSELNVQWDSVSPGLTQSEEMARHMNKGIGNDALPRASNAPGTPSEFGKGGETNFRWQEYIVNFCDPADNNGESGCHNPPTPGLRPNEDLKIAEYLWGERATFDLTVPDNRLLLNTMLANLISPLTPNPVPTDALNTPSGQRNMVQRRAYRARQQAIYNVFATLFALRSVGSGEPDIADIRTAAGVDPGLTSGDPSYREMMEAIARDKIRNPEYVTRLIDEPETLVRVQGNLQAFHLQQLNDIYKRMEELTVLVASDLGGKLDYKARDLKGTPSAASPSGP